MVEARWSKYTLGELFEFSNGINADKSVYGSGIPFVNVLEVIKNESLTIDDIPGRIELSEKAFNRYLVKRGDVLFNRTSETQDEVGLASVYLDRRPVVFGGFVFRGRPICPKLDVSYSKYALRAVNVRLQIISQGQGGIRANISQRDLKSIVIHLPCETEQRAIAETLDDVSLLIKKLECLITKKLAIKRAVMQRWVNSPADEGEHLPLGEIVSFLSGGTPDRSRADYWQGAIPWISATTLRDVEVAVSDQMVTPLAVQKGSRMAPLNSTLLLVRGSALHSAIRASFVTGSVCFNQDIKALVPSSVLIPKFLTYSIHANADKLLALVTSAGNTAGVLDTSVLKSFKIWTPNLETQQHMVSILDDLENELKAIGRKLTKMRSVKKGMVQELLSERTRLLTEGVKS